MADLHSRLEVERAICKMRRGKPGGSSGILLEMIWVASFEQIFLDALLEVVEEVWKEGCVSRDWSIALLVPNLKKGDLSNYDN